MVFIALFGVKDKKVSCWVSKTVFCRTKANVLPPLKPANRTFRGSTTFAATVLLKSTWIFGMYTKICTFGPFYRLDGPRRRFWSAAAFKRC